MRLVARFQLRGSKEFTLSSDEKQSEQKDNAMVNELTLIESVFSELQHLRGIEFLQKIELLNQETQEFHVFYLAEVRGAKVLFDSAGQIWMNEAEIARATDMSEPAIAMAIKRLMESDLSEFVSLNRLLSRDRSGREVELTFFDEETVAAIITRMNRRSVKAMEFLKERKSIIQAVRGLFFDYAQLTSRRNQELQLEAYYAKRDLEDRMRQELEDHYGGEIE